MQSTQRKGLKPHSAGLGQPAPEERATVTRQSQKSGSPVSARSKGESSVRGASVARARERVDGLPCARNLPLRSGSVNGSAAGGRAAWGAPRLRMLSVCCVCVTIHRHTIHAVFTMRWFILECECSCRRSGECEQGEEQQHSGSGGGGAAHGGGEWDDPS